MPQTLTRKDEFAERLQSALKKFRPPPPEAESGAAAPATAAAPTDGGTGPIGGGDHVVHPGQCTSSIAKESGHFWETIWTDPANTALREARKDPNVLLPGDRVNVMPIRRKTESGATQMRHRFVRRGEPAFLRLTLMGGDQPRANQPFVLEVDGTEFRSTTDAEGKLVAPIPGNAKRGRLLIGPEGDQQEFPVNLGQVDPISELSGVQSRLNNLGFGCGPADGKLGPQTRSALLRFQEQHELKQTGEPDDATRAKLQEVHGS
jgi:hypothetical protein